MKRKTKKTRKKRVEGGEEEEMSSRKWTFCCTGNLGSIPPQWPKVRLRSKSKERFRFLHFCFSPGYGAPISHGENKLVSYFIILFCLRLYHELNKKKLEIRATL